MAATTRYIALLRGINVGGHTARMQDLRAWLGELGLQNLRTYIQSGNVFFDSREDPGSLTRKIERRLQGALGYEVAVFLRTVPELEAVLAADPFRSLKLTPAMRLTVVFCSEPIPGGLELPLFSPRKDLQILQASGREAYVVWYLQNGRPPSSPGFLDSTLGKRTTTRFFHTLAKILQAAKAGPQGGRKA